MLRGAPLPSEYTGMNVERAPGMAANPDRRAANPDRHAANPDRRAANPDRHAANPDHHRVEGKGGARVTEEELRAWGCRVGREARPPLFIGLRGPLGAGKSVFARAVARGAGVEGTLPSPTFNLVFRYALPDGRSVIHADLFRIGAAAELAGIGWEELLGDEGAIVLVEWCGRAGDGLPRDRWEIRLGFVPGAAGLRGVEVERCGGPGRLPWPG